MAGTQAKGGVKVSFVREKETKNAVRYQEVGDPDKAKIGTLYIKKSTLGGEPYPQDIEVALSW